MCLWLVLAVNTFMVCSEPENVCLVTADVDLPCWGLTKGAWERQEKEGDGR